MPGLFGAFEIGRRALLAGQAGLSVTSQNIANANTPGYTRKIARQISVEGARLPEGIVGSGVDVTRIERVRDAFLDGRVLGSRAELGDARARASFLREVEATLDDLGDGSLTSAVGAFFDAWHDLALSPESLELRAAVRGAGSKVASLLDRQSEALSEQRRRLAESIPSDVADVNARLGRIAELSRRIATIEAGGAAANESRDERQREVEELSEIVEVSAAESPTGRFLVRVGGAIVADGDHAIGVSLVRIGDDDAAGLSGGGADEGLALVAGSVTLAPRAGALAAKVDAVNAALPSILTRLDEIAEGLAESVNALHAAGTGLDGSTGVAFFDAGEGGAGAAARIRISAAVRADAGKVAASADGGPGDNGTARAIADLSRTATLRGGTRSVGQVVSEMSEAVARETGDAAFLEEARGHFVEALENRRDSVSGVSLDEEAANLVAYQHAYEAAARVMSVANEMIATLLAEVR